MSGEEAFPGTLAMQRSVMVLLSCGVARIGQVSLVSWTLGHNTCQIAAGLLAIVQISHPSVPASKIRS